MISIDILKKLLDNYNEWKIIKYEKNTFSLYVTKGFVTEDIAEGQRKDIIVTLYRDVDNKKGSAILTITSDNEEEVKKQLEDGYEMCKYALRDSFSLPNKVEEQDLVSTVDPEFLDIMKELKMNGRLMIIKEETQSSLKNKAVTMNGMEVIAEYSAVTIENSKGLINNYGSTNIYYELTLTAGAGENEQEFFATKTATRLNNIVVESIIKESIEKVNAVVSATKPKSYNGNVILSRHATAEFFSPHLSLNPLVTHCSAKLKYLKMGRFDKNVDIFTDVKCDSLTISSNPLRDWNPASTPCDGDGVASKNVLLINDGKWHEHFANKQYADYLGVTPTGALGVIEIPPGSVGKNSMFDNCVEIVEFSSFCPNDISGDFSAEIRLGYIHKDGVKTPFKGGTFIGNMFEMFSEVIFSQEMYEEDGYFGPEVVCFKNADVAGD